MWRRLQSFLSPAYFSRKKLEIWLFSIAIYLFKMSILYFVSVLKILKRTTRGREQRTTAKHEYIYCVVEIRKQILYSVKMESNFFPVNPCM